MKPKHVTDLTPKHMAWIVLLSNTIHWLRKVFTALREGQCKTFLDYGQEERET
jgi:hypothetical protein